jgi:hypothetical protein
MAAALKKIVISKYEFFSRLSSSSHYSKSRRSTCQCLNPKPNFALYKVCSLTPHPSHHLYTFSITKKRTTYVYMSASVSREKVQQNRCYVLSSRSEPTSTNCSESTFGPHNDRLASTCHHLQKRHHLSSHVRFQSPRPKNYLGQISCVLRFGPVTQRFGIRVMIQYLAPRLIQHDQCSIWKQEHRMS